MQGQQFTRVLFAGLLCGFAFAASAQSAAVSIDAQAEDAQVPAVQVDDVAVPVQDPLSDRHCLRETGSRIVAQNNRKAGKADQRCVAMPGRAYTREDLERTGHIDIADALRTLDPAIR